LAPDCATSLLGPAHNRIDKLRPIISARFKFLKLNSMVIGQSARQRRSDCEAAAPPTEFVTGTFGMIYAIFRVCKTLTNNGISQRGKTCVVERQTYALGMERGRGFGRLARALIFPKNAGWQPALPLFGV